MDGPDIDTALAWRGRTVRDPAGEKLGTLSELYLHGESDRPAWAGVKRGLLSGCPTIVPLGGIREQDDDLVVPHDRELVESAPDVDPDVELSEEQERLLEAHYGQSWMPRSENEMTRSEEEVDFSKRVTRRAERVRLRKVVVEEQVQQTVPVRREVIQVETDPPPEGTIESVETIDEDPRS